MDDLISRRKAIEAIRIFYADECALVDSIEEQLEKLPSAQPEIIRCKDCKHWGRFGYCTYGTRLAWIGDNDDFCSKGERRTDA